MGLTRRGWATLLGGLAALLAGRVVGLTELYVIGGALAVLAVASAVVVSRARIRLQVSREVRPARVPVDTSCRVELRIRNTALRRSPVLVLSDPVGEGKRARLRLAPLPIGETRLLRYRLPVSRRGIVTVGPLAVEHGDPFGLARRELVTASTIDVIVLPKVHPLAPIPAAPGDEPDSGLHHLRTLANAQEEFSTLREFQSGDDVRKVHWPSTARLGRPIVRHFDQPWQRRTTVVLDVRHAHHDDPSFERAVAAAASVLVLCCDRSELVRLVTTNGQDTGFVSSEQQLDAAMDLLAGIQPAGRGSLTGTLQTLAARRVGGTLVTCTGRLPDAERSTLMAVGTRFGTHVAVSTSSDGPHPIPGSSWCAVVATPLEGALTPAWNAAMEHLGRAAATMGRPV